MTKNHIKRINHYVKNRDLLEELIKCKKTDELSPKLIEMFRLISSRLILKLHFQNPMDKDDVEIGGWTDQCMYWRKFDINRGTNAFAYFSQVCKNGFGKAWNAMYGKKKKFGIMEFSLSGDNFYSF